MLTPYTFTAIGIGVGLSSYPLALNSYFLKKRVKAAGYTMTISGLGPVLVPQLISFLMSTYGIKYSMIIMGGIAGHLFISAALLQPVEWYMKEEIVEDKVAEAEKNRLLAIGNYNFLLSILFKKKKKTIFIKYKNFNVHLYHFTSFIITLKRVVKMFRRACCFGEGRTKKDYRINNYTME